MRQKQCVHAVAPPFQEGKSSNQQPGRGRLDKTHARLGLLFHLSYLLLVHWELQDEGRGDGQRAHSQKALAWLRLQGKMPLRVTVCLSFLPPLVLYRCCFHPLSLPWTPCSPPGSLSLVLASPGWIRSGGCRDNKKDGEPCQFVPLVPVSLSVIPSPDPLALLKQDLNWP